MTRLATHIEYSEDLAKYFGVEDLVLVREDLLPDGGGKKRRALESRIVEFSQFEHIHILSYAGSHTAFTLSNLLPKVQIHLYGSHYGGGAYEKTMMRLLDKQSNIIQKTGSSMAMTLEFTFRKLGADSGQHFMSIGGSLRSDPNTDMAVDQVVSELGQDFHHFAAVAAGDLINALSAKTGQVTGVLTQPWGIRILKILSMKNVAGLKKLSLDKRVKLMQEIHGLTGNLWDPIFMGTLFTFLKRQNDLPPKICLWITCPAGIHWLE